MKSLPDPDFQSEFYSGVAFKRSFAWVLDVIFLSLVTFVFSAVTIIGLFFMPVIYLIVGFLYRSLTLSGRGTFGMRFVGIEPRSASGQGLTIGEACAHTALYYVTFAFVLPIFAHWMLILFGRRKQGISDLILGSVIINRSI